MSIRPEFNPQGLPATIAARVISKAAASSCYVHPEGGTFYVDMLRADRMATLHGGEVFAPTELAANFEGVLS